MAGTTGSTGLNNLLTDTQQVQTTLPSWYDQAQQNIVNQASTALGAAPAFQNTAAQGAVNTLTGPTNPFAQGQTALNTIASGAANPWITSPTGQVTPNTATPLGGLFAAENQQLNQLLPNYTAGANAAGIGSGQFGSLRNVTAVDKAKADAQSNLFAQQMTAALQNQNAGVAAGTGLGSLGTGSIKSGLDVGSAQMNAPFTSLGNYANLINAINVPGTVSQQNQMGGVSTLGALSKIPSASGNLLNSVGITGASFGGLGNKLMNALNLGSGSGSGLSVDASGKIVPGTYPLANGGNILINPDGSKTITAADGTPSYFDATGNPLSSAQGLSNANIIPDTSGLSTVGGDTSAIDNFDYSQFL
jgi:hypothetical protein